MLGGVNSHGCGCAQSPLSMHQQIGCCKGELGPPVEWQTREGGSAHVDSGTGIMLDTANSQTYHRVCFSLYSLGDIILHYTFGIGFISFLSTFFFLYVPALCFKKYFNEDKWTIGKNLLLIIIGIFITGIYIYVYITPLQLKSLHRIKSLNNKGETRRFKNIYFFIFIHFN